MTEAEAVGFLQSGARGILLKYAEVSEVLECLSTVAKGRNWMQNSVFRGLLRGDRLGHSGLSLHEQQVRDLVAQEYKNQA